MMSRSYIKDWDIDWAEYQSEDDEKVFELYNQFEKKDKEKSKKRQTKLRQYEGYLDE